jgi:hypothetical protein
MREALERFFRSPPARCGAITNERSLQLELGLFLRQEGYGVDFERSMKAERLPGSTLKPKHNLDLLVHDPSEKVGIELKVPLNGQHPETMYAFLADIEFVEALLRSGAIDRGFAIMLTPDRAFWTDSGRGSPIHDLFRKADVEISGTIDKPTGARDSSIALEREYRIANNWFDCADLMPKGRVIVIEV